MTQKGCLDVGNSFVNNPWRSHGIKELKSSMRSQLCRSIVDK